MTEKKTAIVLGGIAAHIKLLEVLKAQGYFTVLIDYYDNPPARDYADLHLKESTLDREKVLEITRERGAELIISACAEHANSVACYVAEKLGLTKPYSYETSLEVTNKELMKAKMSANGIPTSRHFICSSGQEAEGVDLKYPVVVKPVDCNGSKGVKKLDSPEDIAEHVDYAISLSRAGKSVVEEFVEGDEIQIDCFAGYDKADVIMIRKRLKIKREEGKAMQSFGSLIPADLSEEVTSKIYDTANRIKETFDLNNTPFFIQAIVSGDDISVIEFAPRIGGSLSSYLIETITGFDVISAAVSSYKEEPVKVDYHKPEFVYATNIMYGHDGIFDRVDGIDDLLERGVIEKFLPNKSKGMELDKGDQMDSRNRVGCYVIKGRDIKELLEKSLIAENEIKVLDINGKDIKRKGLYLS